MCSIRLRLWSSRRLTYFTQSRFRRSHNNARNLLIKVLTNKKKDGQDSILQSMGLKAFALSPQHFWKHHYKSKILSTYILSIASELRFTGMLVKF